MTDLHDPDTELLDTAMETLRRVLATLQLLEIALEKSPPTIRNALSIARMDLDFANECLDNITYVGEAA